MHRLAYATAPRSIAVQFVVKIHVAPADSAYDSSVAHSSATAARIEAMPVTGHGCDDDHWLELWHADMIGRLGISHDHAVDQVKEVRRLLAQLRVQSFADITVQRILDWLNPRVTAARPGARKTAANQISTLRNYGNFLLMRHVIKENPALHIRVPALRNKKRRAYKPFTSAQVDALIAAAKARVAQSWQARGAGPHVYYELLYETALRYSELRHQLVSDIDLEQRTMTVSADKAKRNDTIPLSRRACDIIKAWLASEDRRDCVRRAGAGGKSAQERLFPTAPTHHALASDMQSCGIKHVSDGGERGQWHRFRKAGLADRARNGASVRDLYHFARHTDPKTTLELYDFAQVDELRGVAEMTQKSPAKAAFRKESKKVAEFTLDLRPVSRNTAADQGVRLQGSNFYRVDARTRAKVNTSSDRPFNGVSSANDDSVFTERRKSGAGGNCPAGSTPTLQQVILEAYELTLIALRDAGSIDDGSASCVD